MNKFITPPFKEKVTPEQYENAMKHADFLIKGKLSGEFNMKKYIKGKAYKKNIHICGTAGCSLGYSPESLRIEKVEPFWDFNNEKWDFDQIERILFGVSSFYHIVKWKWCFSSDWSSIDNTSEGAGLRMRMLFNQGLPSDWKEQMYGKAKLSYK